MVSVFLILNTLFGVWSNKRLIISCRIYYIYSTKLCRKLVVNDEIKKKIE